MAWAIDKIANELKRDCSILATLECRDLSPVEDDSFMISCKWNADFNLKSQFGGLDKKQFSFDEFNYGRLQERLQ